MPDLRLSPEVAARMAAIDPLMPVRYAALSDDGKWAVCEMVAHDQAEGYTLDQQVDAACDQTVTHSAGGEDADASPVWCAWRRRMDFILMELAAHPECQGYADLAGRDPSFERRLAEHEADTSDDADADA